MQLLICIEHKGAAFINSDAAVLVFTGIRHHYILLTP